MQQANEQLAIGRWVRLGSVAEALGVSMSTLRAMAKRGEFVELRFFANRWNVREDEVQRWIESQPDTHRPTDRGRRAIAFANAKLGVSPRGQRKLRTP